MPIKSFNSIYKEIIKDLGGETKCTFFMKSHAKRLAGVMYQLDTLEKNLQDGKDVDVNVFNRTQNIYARLCKELGVQPDQKNDEDELQLEDFLVNTEERI